MGLNIQRQPHQNILFVADANAQTFGPRDYAAAAAFAIVLFLFTFQEPPEAWDVSDLLPPTWPPEFGEGWKQCCVNGWRIMDHGNESMANLRRIVLERYGASLPSPQTPTLGTLVSRPPSRIAPGAPAGSRKRPHPAADDAEPFASSHLPPPIHQIPTRARRLRSRETETTAFVHSRPLLPKEVPGAVLINLLRHTVLPGGVLDFLWNCDSFDAMTRAEVPAGLSRSAIVEKLVLLSRRLAHLAAQPPDHGSFEADGRLHPVTPAEFATASKQAAVLCLFHFSKKPGGSAESVVKCLPVEWPVELGQGLRANCVDLWAKIETTNLDLIHMKKIVSNRYGFKEPAQRPDAGLRHLPT